MTSCPTSCPGGKHARFQSTRGHLEREHPVLILQQTRLTPTCWPFHLSLGSGYHFSEKTSKFVVHQLFGVFWFVWFLSLFCLLMGVFYCCLFWGFFCLVFVLDFCSFFFFVWLWFFICLFCCLFLTLDGEGLAMEVSDFVWLFVSGIEFLFSSVTIQLVKKLNYWLQQPSSKVTYPSVTIPTFWVTGRQ